MLLMWNDTPISPTCQMPAHTALLSTMSLNRSQASREKGKFSFSMWSTTIFKESLSSVYGSPFPCTPPLTCLAAGERPTTAVSCHHSRAQAEVTAGDCNPYVYHSSSQSPQWRLWPLLHHAHLAKNWHLWEGTIKIKHECKRWEPFQPDSHPVLTAQLLLMLPETLPGACKGRSLWCRQRHKKLDRVPFILYQSQTAAHKGTSFIFHFIQVWLH